MTSYPNPRAALRRFLAGLAVLTLVAAGCSDSEDGTADEEGLANADPGDCIVVDMAVSPEKIDLLTDLARTFNDSDEARVGDECVFVRPQRKSSGAAMQLLATDWDVEAEGPRPVVWSPASSAWGPILNYRLEEEGLPEMAVDPVPFMLTPLVIAMPQPMAEALGWPDEPIGWATILELARNERGWADFGHPEWGPFRLGKTNPNFSTSGLHALIAQAYAATGKTADLSSEDLAQPEVVAYGEDIESAVVHYGDTTLTFLNNWYAADQRGTALTYVSAAAVEEKSVIDYNTGNPDGVRDPGEEPRKPKIPLVAIYPTEGTLFSDNPFFILEADWVSDEQAEGAALFQEFVQRPENQKRVLEYGFRPGNSEVPIGAPITSANGLDPDEPQTLLEIPSPPVMAELLDRWSDQRKGANVLLVLDISGSMGDTGDAETGETKLDLAKRAAVDALDEFKDDDIVGLRVFSSDLGPENDGFYLDLVPFGRAGDNREQLASAIRGVSPTNGTPLYDVAGASFDTVLDAFDPERINAVLFLTDGVNDDGNGGDDRQQLDDLLDHLADETEGETSRPIRLFTIAYGGDADIDTLREIAEATNAAAYDASDPRSINKVFTAVVSNF